jgi:hypothetical protein
MEVFGQLLDQFDVTVKLGTDGRAKHTGATKQLQALALEAGQIVRVMDARNRMRFKNDQQALGRGSMPVGSWRGLGGRGRRRCGERRVSRVGRQRVGM